LATTSRVDRRTFRITTEGLSQVSTAFCERFEKQLDEGPMDILERSLQASLFQVKTKKHFSEARAVAMALPNVVYKA
jgi:hypothetical protein